MSQETEASAPARRTRTKNIAIPPINWDEDLTNKLLGILERTSVSQKLFGVSLEDSAGSKKSNADPKTVYHQAIAKELFPDLYERDPKGMGGRIQGKISSLINTYREKAKPLKQTGGGVGGDDDEAGLMWIANTGPDHDTIAAAKNIWDRLTAEWSFFPRCHALWATRNTTNPPVTTTGIGPNGRSVRYRRPRGSAPLPLPDISGPAPTAAAATAAHTTPVFVPTLGPADDPIGTVTSQQQRGQFVDPPSREEIEDAIPSNIDPLLNDHRPASPHDMSPAPPPTFHHAPPITPTPVQPAAASSTSHKENVAPSSHSQETVKSNSSRSLSGMAAKAAASAQAAPSSVSKMSSFESTVLKMTREGHQKSHEREMAKLRLQEDELRLSKRAQIVSELKLGLISSKKAKRKLEQLESSDVEPDSDSDALETPVRPKKRTRTGQSSVRATTQARAESPVWQCEDEKLPSSDDSIEVL